VSEIHSRQRLRSACSIDVVVPATRRSSLGDRAFPVAGARAWNALPPVPIRSAGFIIRNGVPTRFLEITTGTRTGMEKHCVAWSKA